MIQRTKEELVFSFDEIVDILKEKVNHHRGHDEEKLSATYKDGSDGLPEFTIHYDSEPFDGGSYA